jgi:hypothetical protein
MAYGCDAKRIVQIGWAEGVARVRQTTMVKMIDNGKKMYDEEG